MATLTGSSISSSYEQLLSLPDGGGNGTNLVAVTDGDAGTTFDIQLSSNSTNFQTDFQIGGTTVDSTAAELNYNAGVTAGTVTASRALVVDANKDIATLGNVTMGNLTSTGIDDNATSTAITIDSSENVLIGATSVQGTTELLNVFNSAIVAGPNIAITSSLFDGSDYMGGLLYRINDVADTVIGYVKNKEHSANSYGIDIGGYGTVGSPGTIMTLLGSGNVGISETTPSKLLDLKNGASGGDILCFDIYTHDGGVETSDERMKENISYSALGLDFVNALNPVSYKWKDVDEIVEKETFERQKTVKVEKEITRTDVVEEDGKYIQKEITETQEVDEPVFDEADLYDEDGKVIGTHKIPVMEEVEEIVNQYDAETYSRTHYGMIAQEVMQVLEDAGMGSNDFAGYIYEEDRDRFGLRYNEFISPLIKAVQELSAKVEALENK